MMCPWKELLGILPAWLRSCLDENARESLQELRLRINSPPELVFGTYSRYLERDACQEDISHIVNAASRYSPWAAATAAQGYITAHGGHRIGLCGEVVCKDGTVAGIRDIVSVCIRVARDFPGISNGVSNFCGSILIIGAPGWGKTTLLRDLARQIGKEKTVAVVDERRELFPEGFSRGKRMDVLTGCPKSAGISMVLRTMGPDYIAVDEITDEEDCSALVQAANCGVRLLATAHAGSMQDYLSRPVYRRLREQGIFDTLLILRQDKSWRAERMEPCTTNGSVRYW